MKRIHLKRKPPKIKTVFMDGKSVKTKYIRMQPVLNENVKKEVSIKASLHDSKKIINQNSTEEGTSGIFINEEEAMKNTYREKKEKIIAAWSNLRLNLLSTRIEELSPATYTCCLCSCNEDSIIFCQDCGPTAYYCSTCCERVHQNIVFHMPHKWKDCLYVPIKMSNDLVRKDDHCTNTYTSSVYAVDFKGRQHVCNVQFCRCEDPAVTLLRYRMWPATPTNPKIAFDLRFMELLTVLQLECHLPSKSFCEAFSYIHSNNINLRPYMEKNIYRAVVGDCLTEYHFHRSSLNTKEGVTGSTLYRECPICLKNPSIISMDANFGLVHKSNSGDGHGRHNSRHKDLFFLNHMELKKFIDDYAADTKSLKNECSNFQAGNVIRSKIKNKKLDVTGVFGSVCKHDIPISFVDLSHGERLSYPVYILKHIMGERTCTEPVVVMYDIACSLHRHLKKNENNELLQKCSFAVPVFHSFAHNTACQLNYGQRYTSGAGLTDGEGIERLWSYLRGFSKITKEMNLNNRQDLLTEALLHYSEKQVWSLGKRLASKKIKCENLIQETEKVIADIMVEFSVTDTDGEIESWLKEWKLLTCNSNKNVLHLSLDERYADCLNQIDLKRQQIQVSESSKEKEDIERTIKRLIKECEKYKKNTGRELHMNTEPCISLLLTINEKKKKNILTKLKQYAMDRQYLSSMMKKYADGQGIGLRISRQFSTNGIKIGKELQSLNALNETRIEYTSVISPDSAIYQDIESKKLTEKQQKCIQTKTLLERAKEERDVVLQESILFCDYLTKKSCEILQEIENLQEDVRNRKNLGMLQYLHLKHLNLEILSDLCNFNLEEAIIPRLVHNILSVDVLSNKETDCFPTKDEMQIILQEIEALEECRESDNEDDDDDDDDDNGDDDDDGDGDGQEDEEN